MRVYLAAPYAARDQVRRYAAELERVGFVVSSTWHRETHEISSDTTGPAPGLSAAEVAGHAATDLQDIDRSDLLVVLTEAAAELVGGNGTSGGRHVETGYALASGNPVVVVGEPENVFHRLGRACTVVSDWPRGRHRAIGSARRADRRPWHRFGAGQVSVYPTGVEVRRGAAISGDGLYRYSLTREWCPERQLRIRLTTFVMLNPSTADADRDDPTIRRCVGFARALGYDGIRVVNLYAFRATKPADLWLAPEPTGGQRNDDLLAEVGRLTRYGDPLIAAWGAHARPDRVDHVRHLPGWENLTALGVTKHGAPRHPLYLPSSAKPFPWPIDPNGHA